MSQPFMSSTTLSSKSEISDDVDDVFNVVLRVRPLNSQEVGRRDKFVVEFPDEGQVSVTTSGSNRNFKFNAVLEPSCDQEEVFESCGIKRLVDAALNGFTCTAFAFGQTGSGKTHTMTGPPFQNQKDGLVPDQKMAGIIQRSFRYLFQQISTQGTARVIRASYLEIYNEQVIDLLNNTNGRYLSVRWNKKKNFYVENLFTVLCETMDDLMAVLEEGLRNRQKGSHGLNELSSRSHSVLTVTIDSEVQPEPEDQTVYVINKGKLSFVDLAGSEKVKDAATSGTGITETNSINKSLLVLGNCISHLGDSKRRLGHIPYRDSKLTKLLCDSLAGNGITLMIACITPSSANVTETANTLRYASRAKKIKTKPIVKVDPRETLILSLKKEVRIIRQENHYLRQQLDFPAKPKGQLQKENDEQFLKLLKQQEEKESGLYEMLQEYMVENESLRIENSSLHATKDALQREQQVLHRENERLGQRLEEMERLISQNPPNSTMANHQRVNGFNQWDPSSWRSISNADYYGPSQRSGVKLNGYQVGIGGNQPRPTANQNQPMRPPHRLADRVPVSFSRPNDNFPTNERIDGHMTSPRSPPFTSKDSNRDMNERLLMEVKRLDGEIAQHSRTPRGPIKTSNKEFYR